MIQIPYEFPGEVKYQTYAEMESRIFEFDDYRTIGRDATGQFNMYEITMGTTDKPVIMITAGMHGPEWQGSDYTMTFIEQLRDGTFPDRDFSNYLLNNFELSIMPVLNPYGFVRTTEYAITRGRQTSQNIDMNRDFEEFRTREARNVKSVMDSREPFSYLDAHLIRGANRPRHLIIGNGQYETVDIRDVIADSWQSYAFQSVERWAPSTDLEPGLSRRYMRDAPNPHTPFTLSYITELSRPVEENDGFSAPLSNREIHQYGMASIYLFLQTSIDYYQRYHPEVLEPIYDRTLRVRNLQGDEYMLQASVTHDYQLNGNQSLSFTVQPTRANNLFIHDIGEMWEVIDNNDVVHKVVHAKRQGRGQYDMNRSQLSVEIQAVPKFFDDFDNSRIYEEYNEHMPANRAFDRIFDGMDFEYIITGQFYAVDWEGFGAGESRLETFKRALDRYHMEFRIVSNIVYLEHQIGRDTSFQYRHRLNATNIVHEIDANEMWTYARGYGDYGNSSEDDEATDGTSDWQDAGLVREYESPLSEIIGIRHAPPIKNGNITRTDTMDDELEKLVEDSLQISVTADVHDLREQGYALAQPVIGDRTFIIDERIGVDVEVRIVDMSITRDWYGDITNFTVTFGSDNLSKRHQANLATAAKTLNDAIEGKRELPYSVVDSRVKHATEALRNAETELIFGGNGIVAQDVPDPNKVVVLNSRGVGVSTDGGDSFTESITGEGINVSTVTTGSMLADYIAGGMLESLNGNTHFNLNTGYLDMENANFVLGNGAGIQFTDRGNTLTFRRDDGGDTRSSGLIVGEEFRDDDWTGQPIVSVGSSIGTHHIDNTIYSWAGLTVIPHGSQDDAWSTMTSQRFMVRDRVNYNRAIQFDMTGSSPSLAPVNAGSFDYQLGLSGNPFRDLHVNNVNEMSAHNTKRDISRHDRGLSTRFVDDTNVYNFYYKTDRITAPNKKIGLIIENIDPVYRDAFVRDNQSVLLGNVVYSNQLALKETRKELKGVEDDMYDLIRVLSDDNEKLMRKVEALEHERKPDE